MSFLVRKNKIVSFGCNSYVKTHPLNSKFGYNSDFIHSELACILNANKIDSKCYMINVRINKDNNLLISKPCDSCQQMLLHHGIFKVVFSTKEGFQCMKI